MDFASFGKMPRLFRECIITEKIDGTNAQVCITEDGEMFTGSRTRWITPQEDNFGFAQWALDNKEKLDDYKEKAQVRIREKYCWDKIADQYEQLFYDMHEGFGIRD